MQVCNIANLPSQCRESITVPETSVEKKSDMSVLDSEISTHFSIPVPEYLITPFQIRF